MLKFTNLKMLNSQTVSASTTLNRTPQVSATSVIREPRGKATTTASSATAATNHISVIVVTSPTTTAPTGRSLWCSIRCCKRLRQRRRSNGTAADAPARSGHVRSVLVGAKQCEAALDVHAVRCCTDDGHGGEPPSPAPPSAPHT